MLKFNTLLADAGLDPEKVYLLRHQDRRMSDGRTVYSVWRSQKDDFEMYQRIQKWENRFEVGALIASFVVTPDGDTLFVGLYEITDLTKLTDSVFDPMIRHYVPAGHAFHTTGHCDLLADFKERLVIDWGLENELGGSERICKIRTSLRLGAPFVNGSFLATKASSAMWTGSRRPR